MALQYSIDIIAERGVAVLHIAGGLDFDLRTDFHQGMTQLLDQEPEKLVVDMANVTRMSSVFIGTLVDFGLQAKGKGKQLSCIVNEKIERICSSAGLDKAVPLIRVRQKR